MTEFLVLPKVQNAVFYVDLSRGDRARESDGRPRKPREQDIKIPASSTPELTIITNISLAV
jgi:hypothetical protein